MFSFSIFHADNYDASSDDAKENSNVLNVMNTTARIGNSPSFNPVDGNKDKFRKTVD